MDTVAHFTDLGTQKKVPETVTFDGSTAAVNATRLSTLIVLDNNDVKLAQPLPETSTSPHSLFPEGINESNAPKVVKASWEHVQSLSPEKTGKISYYEKDGEWFINLDGIKISLENETAKNNPDEGVNVIVVHTYFSRAAALKHAESKKRELPTEEQWKKMADFLGGFKQLKDVLQLPLTGFLHPNDVSGGNLVDYGNHSNVWSKELNKYVLIERDEGGFINQTNYPSRGFSARLLDA